MQVVYSPAHLGHDITVETYMGSPIPANEVAERAERIRTALEADGGFSIIGPTEHGVDPITAVHDPGLVRFLEVAWSEHRAQGIDRPFLTADTYPNRSMFEGMSDEAVSRLVREPVHARGTGRVLGPRFRGAARRRHVRRRARRRRCRADGRGPRAGRRDGGLRAVPAARPSRRPLDVRRLLLLQQRRDRGRGDRPVRPASGSRSSTSTSTTATARSRSSGAAATSATSRSTPIRTASTRTSSAVPTRPGRARGPGRT